MKHLYKIHDAFYEFLSKVMENVKFYVTNKNMYLQLTLKKQFTKLFQISMEMILNQSLTKDSNNCQRYTLTLPTPY